jgi:hypothetical protein
LFNQLSVNETVVVSYRQGRWTYILKGQIAR